jgi:hypothetical protein
VELFLLRASSPLFGSLFVPEDETVHSSKALVDFYYTAVIFHNRAVLQ